jgi:polysaccharide chain length determinant protein (PEP-CTERM system associated)
VYTQAQKVLEELQGTWRYRWQALTVAWVVAVLGWSVAVLWRDVYRANARVFVDTGSALKPVLQGLAVAQDVDAQLNFVRQSLLSTPVLNKIAADTGLLTADMGTVRRARVIEDMAGRVVIYVHSGSDLGNEGREASGIVYGITYRDRVRARALSVVESLLHTLIEDTLGNKREGSQEAQKFLESQIREYERRLSAAEQRLADFKKQNVGVMPTDQGGYFTRLQNELDAVKTGESALTVAISRRDEIKRQLYGESAVTSSAASPPSGGPGTAGGGDTLSRMRETQAKLDELLLRFTDEHPDVIAAREALEELKRRRNAEVDAMRQGDADAVANSGAGANPVYQSIQLALNQADLEVATLRRQLDDHRARVAELRKALNTMPQVEAEFGQLNRDYDVNKTQFTALLVQLQKAKLGQDAETNGSLRFEVIEPPNADFRAVQPSRTMLLGVILLVALAAGVGVAFLRHKLNPVFWSPVALAGGTSVGVLGVVSSAFPASLGVRGRKDLLLYSLTAASLVLVAVGLVRISQLHLITLPAGLGIGRG